MQTEICTCQILAQEKEKVNTFYKKIVKKHIPVNVFAVKISWYRAYQAALQARSRAITTQSTLCGIIYTYKT